MAMAVAAAGWWLRRVIFLGVFLVCCQRWLDRCLGWLVGWAMAKTPKRFLWTMDQVKIRPSFSWAADAWSEITVVNWTWHNPHNFGVVGEEAYILQIDRVTLRLDLLSVYAAIRHRQAVSIDLVLVEGLRFRATRNQEAELNLWEALDLPDEDLNVSVVVQRAREHGGYKSPNEKYPMAKPLPAVSTKATRGAAKYWRPAWGDSRSKVGLPKPSASQGFACLSPLGRLFSCYAPCGAELQQAPVVKQYHEYPIGDPRRRPRWGVPIRFDIRQAGLINGEVWIFDLLTMDKRQRFIEPGDTKMTIGGLMLSRAAIEARDPRRKGNGDGDADPGDGVHGVYLGELVWVLIAALLPKLFEHSPTELLKNATFAAMFGARDSAVHAGALAVELGINLKSCFTRSVPRYRFQHRGDLGGCYVQVHLIRGVGVADQGKRVNVHARILLRRPKGEGMKAESVAEEDSILRVWTKTPWWDQHFVLGQVDSVDMELRIVCLHRKTRHATEPLNGGTCDRYIGEVVIPLRTLLVRDSAIADGRLVGWWDLYKGEAKSGGAANVGLTGPVESSIGLEGGAEAPRPNGWLARWSQRGAARGTSARQARHAPRGRVKLGLKLVGAEHLGLP